MISIFELIVDEESNLMRLDLFLVDNLDDLSREKIKLMIVEGKVLVNDLVSKANYKIKTGDNIKYSFLEEKEVEILPANIPIDVVYEDDDVIVINKPTGMVVHPSIGHYNDTLVNALMYHTKNLSSINGEIRPGIVHRIDKDTSGLLIVAKNDKSHIDLSNQLQSKSVSRKYLALVQGEIPHELGKIDAPIGRDPKDRIKMACVKGGKDSVTHFAVLERFNNFTLIECTLETGRTHQIRVHMSYIGFPIAGDSMYGRRKVIGNKGQILHAYKLGFIHPTTKEYMEFTSEIEEDFAEMLDKLRSEKNNSN